MQLRLTISNASNLLITLEAARSTSRLSEQIVRRHDKASFARATAANILPSVFDFVLPCSEFAFQPDCAIDDRVCRVEFTSSIADTLRSSGDSSFALCFPFALRVVGASLSFSLCSEEHGMMDLGLEPTLREEVEGGMMSDGRQLW